MISLSLKKCVRTSLTKLIPASSTSASHRFQSSLPNAHNYYTNLYKRSIDSTEDFFADISTGIDWFQPWKKIHESKYPFQRWFVDGQLNTCYNAVDRHVLAGRGDQYAVIHDSPVTDSKQTFTYRQLQQQVSLLAGVLTNRGVSKGDRVIIYMPMIPQALISMLACARIGAVHCLVFGGFSAKELSVRIDHCQPKVVLTANCGIEPTRLVEYVPIVENAIAATSITPKVIIYNRPQMDRVELKQHQYCYEDEMDKASPQECVPLLSHDPLYILYTSGTTGQPKGVLRSNGGHAVALNYSMKALYGLDPGEVWWSASDLGWIVGHSYICYAPLLHGNTTVIYEGKPVGTPDSGSFFRVLQEWGVAAMFTAPTAIRAIRKVDPDASLSKQYDFSKFKYLFVAGEHCDVETLHWCKKVFKRPVLDNWWQTETGWAITCTNVGLGNSLDPPDGSTGLPVPGWNVKVVRPDGTEAKPGELGNIVVKYPLPPGFADTLYTNDSKFKEYFNRYPGYYDTADSGFRNELGYISVMARTDDIINVAGHRLSTSALEEAIMAEEAVAECAVVGIKDTLKGQVPLGICVLKKGDVANSVTTEHIVSHVREHVGPVAAFKLVLFVPGLPKTRSGKIARATIAALAESRPFKVPPTIEDAGVYKHIKEAMQEIGLAKDKEN